MLHNLFPPHRYWTFVALAIAVLSTLFLAYGWMDRRAELRMGEREAAQISEYASLIANGTLQSSHQLVHAMELLARQSGRGRTDDISARLRQMKAINPHISDLLIIDRKGNIAFRTLDAPPLDVSDRDYVVHHMRNKGTELFISGPTLARANPGNWFFALSEALRDARGELDFILVVIIGTRAMHDIMATEMAIPDSSQVLMTPDGKVYARHPAHEASVGRQVIHPDVMAALSPERPAITTTIISQLDQRERIVSFRRLGAFPLVAAGTVDTQTLLTPWRKRMQAMSVAWIALVAAILAAFAAIISKDRRMTQALAESDRFRKALDHVPAFVYMKDIESRYLYANQPTLDLFGCSQQQLVGADDSRFFPPETSARLRQIDLDVLAGRSTTEEVDVPNSTTGHRVYLEVKTPLRDLGDPPQIVGLCGISTDITDLKDQQAGLERTVLERTRDLMEAKDQAEAANRAKTTFLANMGHELKTPLNGILGMVGIALKRQSDPRTIHQLEVAKESAERLLQMLNDILDFAKLEADHLALESELFDLAPLIENVRFQHEAEASEKNLALRADLPPPVIELALIGDPLRLRRVIGNLLANAIKFSDEGEIILRVLSIEESAADCLLRFEVEDHGIGISGEERARLFSAFEQADGSMTRKYGGTGIGLAICKRLVALMQGEIGVDSTPGQGSTFWFTARFARPAMPGLTH